MSLHVRKPKNLLTASIIIFLLCALWSRKLFGREATGWITAPKSHTGDSSKSSESKLDGSTSKSDKTPSKNAHKLGFADEFLAHFEKVMALPGMTMNESKRTCTWDASARAKINWMWSDNLEWVTTDRPESEIDFRRRQWHAFVNLEMIPWEAVKNRFHERGLVIVAGNTDTIMRLKVVLRALVKLRSRIPVEVHYFGEDEINDATRKELAELYSPMYFSDLSSKNNIIQVRKDSILGINFQLKTAAMVNSRFAEPFLLDSDNVPVIDPMMHYSSLVYREYGTVFWPDIVRTRPNNPMWAITNTPCRMDEYELESGQAVVDKRRYWYHLQLAAWMNNAKDAYWNNYILGDKDTFRFAWLALKTDYGKPKKWLTSVGTLNEGYFCGHTFAQHHPDDSRLAFMHMGLTKTVALEVLRWNRDERGGYFRHYKRSPDEESPQKIVKVGMKWDGADYKPNHTAEFKTAWCTDMYDVEARDLDEILPGFERTFEEIGGYWQLDEEDRRVGNNSARSVPKETARQQ